VNAFLSVSAGICVSLVLSGATAGSDLAAQTIRSATPAREILRIRGEDADLSTIALLAVSDKGVLAVAQRRERFVRLFASDGKPIATVGRSGGGPWEFQQLNALGWVGDTLWVADQSLKRITTFHASGAPGEMTELPLQLTAPGITNMRFMFPSIAARLPDATLLVQASALALPEGAPKNPAMNDPQWALRVSAAGAVQRIIGRDPPNTCQRERGENVVVVLAPALCPRKVVATRSDGSRRVLLTTQTTTREVGTYQVLAVNASGDTLYSRTYSVPLTRISALSRDSLLGESGSLLIASDIPAYFYPLQEAHLLPGGGVWIGLTSGNSALREWRRLDPRGQPLPSVWLPRTARVLAVESRGAWAVVTDGSGFQDLVLYAAPRP
jgi:hypothetical protein